MTATKGSIRLARAEDVAEALITLAIDPEEREQILPRCRQLAHGEPETAAYALALMSIALVNHYAPEVKLPASWQIPAP